MNNSNDNLWKLWVAVATVFCMTVCDAPAANIVVLYALSNSVDGGTPYGGVIQASNGVLYGTTVNGGTNGYGAIFSITTNGLFTPLYSFKSIPTDGAQPYAGLVQGTNGNFYGTASQAGSNNYGSIYKMTSAGGFAEMYGFSLLHLQQSSRNLTNTDGANPGVGLVQGTNGNFYGAAPAGGSNGYGAVFEITAAGAFTRLYSFTNGADGANPGGLMQSSNGLIYGTATNGGNNGCGAIFKMTAAGVLTPLYSFMNGVDGAHPGPALTQGTNGVLYGATSAGGTNGSGTIFQITTNGVFSPLYSFATASTSGLGLMTNADGIFPGSLAQGGGGVLYGFCQAGGLNGTGTLFQFSPTGGLSVLWTFLVGSLGSGGWINAFGANPTGITLGRGVLYGTTKDGGSNSFGTVFQLGIPPQISSQPASLSLALGSTATFSIGAAATACQWQFDGANIPNATNLSLTNINIQITNAGLYQAIVSNAFGWATSSVACLYITNVPVSFATQGELEYGGGGFGLLVTNLTGQGNVVVEASSDFKTWVPIITNPPAFGLFPFTDSSAGGYSSRFYRAHVIPAP